MVLEQIIYLVLIRFSFTQTEDLSKSEDIVKEPEEKTEGDREREMKGPRQEDEVQYGLFTGSLFHFTFLFLFSVF